MRLCRGEVKGMNLRKFRNIDMREVFAYIVLMAFFFWWQKFFPNMSFAYIEKVTLGVRVLYSIVLADTEISSVKKLIGLWVKKKVGSETTDVEVKESEVINEVSTDELINSASADRISKSEPQELAEQNSKLSSISDFMFYASFALCFGFQLISSTRFPSIIHFFAGMQRLGVNLSCLMAIFLFNRKPAIDIKLLVLQIFILIADIGYLAVYGGIWLYPMMIFVVGAYGRRFLPVVHIALIESAVVIIATFYCSLTGIIEMVIKDGGKHAYGYAGPNEASMQYLFFLMMYFFARYYAEKKRETNLKGIETATAADSGLNTADAIEDNHKNGEAAGLKRNPLDEKKSCQKNNEKTAVRILNIVDALILSLGLMFIVSYSSGRASIVCVLTLTVGVLIYKLSKLYPAEKLQDTARNAIDKVFLLLFVPIFGYATAFSFASAYLFDPDKPYGWIQKIGKVFDITTLTLRLNLGKQALLNYSPSIFGTFVEESLEDDTYFIVDNYYIKSFLQYGLIYFACTLLILFMINFALWKRKEYFTLFLVSIVAGLGFLEAQIGQMQYDIFPLIVFTCDIGYLALKKTEHMMENQIKNKS